MPEVDDIALLREFVDGQSESAFAEIVERRVNLVYSVALRFTGNSEDAQDVTQAVFVILARKAAGLTGGWQRRLVAAVRFRGDGGVAATSLTGWLYETTRFAAMNFLTRKSRRQAREQEAYMQSTLNDEDAENLWPLLAPLLESAMSCLNERDRTLVALRFFENRSMAETAALLGVNEPAARKRSARVLEKLHTYFSKRGVNSTAETIAGAISTHSIQAAPGALAKTATAMAIAKGATASASTLTLIQGALKIMAWTKAQTAIVAGAAILLATGTSVVVVAEIHSHSSAAAHAAFNELPQTLAELNAWYVEPPAGQNAATFNLQAIQAMQLAGADQNASLPILGKLPPPPPNAPLSSAEKAALADFVHRNRAAMQLFAQAAQYGQSRYPVDLTQGTQTLLPHLIGIKRGLQTLEMAAILDAANRDGQQAADDVLTSLALAHSLEAEPVLISQLVRVAGASFAVSGLNQIVNRTTLPPESAAALLKAFQEMEAYDARGEGFKRGMAGEWAMHMAVLKDPDAMNAYLRVDEVIPADRRQRMQEFLKQGGKMKPEQDAFASCFQQLMALHEKPFPARLKANAAFPQYEAKAAKQGLIFNAWFWSGFGDPFNQEGRCLADLRLGLAAVALEQFRAAHGQYPDKLSELTPNYLPTTPSDPFDGKSLRYRKQNSGYVLYSIGPDRKDDGGRPIAAHGGDMVFSVTAPAH